MPARLAPPTLAVAAAIALVTGACTIPALPIAATGEAPADKPGSTQRAGQPRPAGQQQQTAPGAPGGDGGAPIPRRPGEPSGRSPAGQLPDDRPPGTPSPPRASRQPGGPLPGALPSYPPGIAEDVPAVYKRVYGATSILVEGEHLIVVIKGLPDHDSPYYAGTAWADKASQGEPGWAKAPNAIAETRVVFELPLAPTEDPTHPETPLGPIGFSLNGVPFYNQYAMGRQALTHEIVSFDRHRGHPDPMGGYHYHLEPKALIEKLGEDALLGFLLDGFPVYGSKENGKAVTNADLDAYHGHRHATADFPAGIYHYHFTAEAPYLNGAGFYGKPGRALRGGSGAAQQPGGAMPPPPSGCPTPPPPGQTPVPPRPGGTPPPSHCPKPPGGFPPPPAGSGGMPPPA